MLTAPIRTPLLGVLVLLAGVLLRQAPPALGAMANVSRSGEVVTVENGLVALRYDLASGLADYSWGGHTVVHYGYSTAALSGGGRTVTSFDPGQRAVDDQRFSDQIGSGVLLRVTTALPGDGVALVQQFFVYDDAPFLTQRLTLARLSGDAPVQTDQMEVMAASPASQPAGGVTVGGMTDPLFYKAPFYNDGDFEVVPRAQARGALSYWLGGVVDAAGGAGLIAGAVETTAWKSGVWYDGPSNSISAHSGTRSPVDTVQPAPRSGRTVDSALTFIGFGPDYSDVLARLMQAVGKVEPPLTAPALPAPIGWSAWYQHGLNTDEATVRGVTDFIARNWSGYGYRYINLDAGWNRADGDTRFDPQKFPNGVESLVSYIHERGLLAGGYFVPFAISPSLLDQPAPGSQYLYRDLILRDSAGAPVRPSTLNWEYVLDLSHPGAVPLVSASARRLADYGFDFVKLDFLQIGTQEGARYDPNMTAMQAFHRGMRAIDDAFDAAGRPIFVSAAISPLYVQQYVHSRRVGNDVEFGQARQARNVALSWFTGLLYHRNDPDNAVVRRTWFPGYSDELAKLHVTMDALGGTLFIAGDDPRDLSPARAALLTNPDVLAIANRPLVIQPLTLSGDPPAVWVAEESSGSRLVGVFNWSGAEPARFTFRFRDLKLDERGVYRVYDLWTQQDLGNREFSFTVELPPHGAALLRVSRG